MRTKIRVSVWAMWLLGPVMIAAAMFGVRIGEIVEAIPFSDAIAGSSASTAAARMSEQEALAAISFDAASRLSTSLGSDHVAHDEDGEVIVLATTVDGQAISLDDLELKDFRFVPNTREVRTSIGTGGAYGSPKNVWVAAWELTGVTPPGWDTPAVVQVTIIMDDGTGDILGAAVGQHAPQMVQAAP